MQKMGANKILNNKKYLPCASDSGLYHIKFLLKDTDTKQPLKNTRYEITLDDNTKLEGISDEQGYTSKIISLENKITNLKVFKPIFIEE